MAYQLTHNDCIARVQGGRLIEALPFSVDKLMLELTKRHKVTAKWVKNYRKAFEADIINLLIGPLAEAKHVADVDDELFNYRLITLKSLENYGGESDLALVNEYAQSFSSDKQQRNEKLDELFAVAFDFVDNHANWKAITRLAGYIIGSSKNIICCEEIVSILDQAELPR